jgi:hypothetical protein
LLLKRAKEITLKIWKAHAGRDKSAPPESESQLKQECHKRSRDSSITHLFKRHPLNSVDVHDLKEAFASEAEESWFVGLQPTLVDFVGGFLEYRDWPAFVASAKYDRAIVPAEADPRHRNFVPTFGGPRNLAKLLRGDEAYLCLPRIGEANKFTHLRPYLMPRILDDLKALTETDLEQLGLAFRELWAPYFRESSSPTTKRSPSTSPSVTPQNSPLKRAKTTDVLPSVIDLTDD